jgi:hypothetical protein
MLSSDISFLGENIVDSYLSISTGKDMWDAVEAKSGVSENIIEDADTLLRGASR